MHRFIFKIFILACALLCNSAYANVSLQPQSTVFSINDTINLVLEYSGDASTLPSSQPDLSPLNDLFEIGGQQTQKSSSTNIKIRNGKTERITEARYKILLAATPIKEGKQTIPAITWGKFKTQPVQVTVTPQVNASNLGNGMQSNFFAEAEVTNTSPYVQEQIILTVKAYSTDRFVNGGFGMQFPDNVVAKLTGQDDKVYKTALNGQTYFVQERQLILYMERSGNITLPPISFNAQLLTNDVNTFGFRMTRDQRTRTQKISLNVRPVPSNASDKTWLPAQSLALSHYLEKDDYEVGTPMTLTLSTVAEGIISEQMPEPDLSALKKRFKIYPDQPDLKSRWDNGAVVSTRIDKIALIPITSGKQTIPPITLDWWNTKADQAETASTTPITIDVKASVNDTPNTLPSLEKNVPTAEDKTALLENLSRLEAMASQRVSKYWQYATVLFAILTTGLMLWIFKIKDAAKKSIQNTLKPAQPLVPTISTSDAIKQISDDPKRARQYVLLWARGNIDPKINSIRDIIIYCNQSADHKELAESLVQLNKCLYDAEKAPWDAKNLKKAIKQFKPYHSEETPKKMFLSLYPKN